MRKNLSKKTLSAFLAIVMTLATMAGMFTFAAGAETTANGVTSADVSWYTDTPTQNEIFLAEDTDDDGIADTYTITTANQLAGFASILFTTATTENTELFKGKTIKLGNDIDLNPGWDASTKTAPTTAITDNPYTWPECSLANNKYVFFGGIFDGQGHSISGVYKKYSRNNFGMFATVSGEATIKNLIIENSYFDANTGMNNVGGLFGYNKGVANIYNVGVSENVYCAINRSSFGFFVGLNSKTVNIRNSIFLGELDVINSKTYAMSSASGFVGYVNASTNNNLINCIFAGDIVESGDDKAPYDCCLCSNYFVAKTKDLSSLILTNCYYIPDGDVKYSEVTYTEIKDITRLIDLTGLTAVTTDEKITSYVDASENTVYNLDYSTSKKIIWKNSENKKLYEVVYKEVALTNVSYIVNASGYRPFIVTSKEYSELNGMNSISIGNLTGIAAQTLLNSMTYTDTTTSTTYNMNAWVATTTGTPELRADVTASATAAPKGAKISDGATTDFGWYGFQYGTGENSDSLRLLGTVKAEARNKYDSIGFKAVAYFVDHAGNKVQTNSVTYTTVYESVAADGTPIKEDGSYFFAQTVKNLPDTQGNIVFEITTYAMQGSTEIIGDTYRIVYDCLQHDWIYN